MGEWIWGAVAAAVALEVAGGITWWLAKGCKLTLIGATGAILGGLLSLGALVVLIDPDAAIRATAIVSALSGVWLLAWALAGGIRGSRLDAAAAKAALSAPAPSEFAVTAFVEQPYVRRTPARRETDTLV